MQSEHSFHLHPFSSPSMRLFIVTVCSLVCVSAFSFQSLLASVCLCGCPPICLHIYTPPSLCAKPTVSVCLHVLHFCLTSPILFNFLSLCLRAISIQCSVISTFTTVTILLSLKCGCLYMSTMIWYLSTWIISRPPIFFFFIYDWT